MYIKQATVNNQVGLHARLPPFLFRRQTSLRAPFWVEKDDQRVNAKSLLGDPLFGDH